MGCSISSEIDVKRNQVQLFEQDGEENRSRIRKSKEYTTANENENQSQKKREVVQITNDVRVGQQIINLNSSQIQNKQKSISIRTMTFNIANQDSHKGFSKYRAKNIAKHIVEVQPQIIGFQELREDACIKSNQLERILKEMKKIQPDFRWYSVWAPSMIYKKMGVNTCAEGLGVISRFPIKRFKQELIPFDKEGEDGNQRAVLIVDLEEIDVQICVTHLSYIAELQLQQTKDLRQIIDNEYVKSDVNLNQIVLGDFNYHDEEKAKILLQDQDLRAFKDTAIELNHISNTWQLYRYDRIYFRGRSLIPSRIICQQNCKCHINNTNINSHIECIDHYCSDHSSLFSEFLYEF